MICEQRAAFVEQALRCLCVCVSRPRPAMATIVPRTCSCPVGKCGMQFGSREELEKHILDKHKQSKEGRRLKSANQGSQMPMPLVFAAPPAAAAVLPLPPAPSEPTGETAAASLAPATMTMPASSEPTGETVSAPLEPATVPACLETTGETAPVSSDTATAPSEPQEAAPAQPAGLENMVAQAAQEPPVCVPNPALPMPPEELPPPDVVPTPSEKHGVVDLTNDEEDLSQWMEEDLSFFAHSSTF